MQNDIGVGALGAMLGVFFTGLFAWLVQRSKGESEQSVAVLAQWEKLTRGISERLATVERNFAEYREQAARDMDEMRDKCRRENEEMREKHRAEMRALRDQNDDLRKKHDAEMSAMRELNEGLQRMIAQNSKSTAYLMGDSPVTEKDE